MHITDIRRQLLEDGTVELSALVSAIPGRTGPFRLWFRLPERYLPTASADPFVAALLPIGIVSGKPLVVDGAVSAQLVRNSRQLSAIWRKWEPSFLGCTVEASARREPCPPGPGVGCFFTGGVDSFYTLRRLFDLNVLPTHLVFIRGYAEMPLTNTPLYSLVQRHLRAVAEELGLQLVPVSTNLRDILTYAHVDWDLYAGSTLACAGLCLESTLHRIYVPSGDTYATLSPWGSHPITDPLWGTERLEFVHHGCEASRSEKVEHAVAPWPLALAHLRVCGSGLGAELNCGCCEKCLRSAIALEACGALRACETLPPLNLSQVRELDSHSRVIAYYLRDNLALAKRRGGYAELELALRAALSPSLSRRARWRALSVVRRADQRWLGGMLRRAALAAVSDAKSEADLKTDPGRWLLRRWWSSR